MLAAAALFGSAAQGAQRSPSSSSPPAIYQKASTSIDLEALSKDEIYFVNVLIALIRRPSSAEDMEKAFQCIVKTLCSKYLEEKSLENGPKTLADTVKSFAQASKIQARDDVLRIRGKLAEKLATLARSAMKNPKKYRWAAVACTNASSGKTYKTWEVVDSTSQYVFLKRKKGNYSTKELFVARVLYAETSSVATEEEVKLICRVILNRIGKKDFGNAQDAYSAVRVKNAFSSIDDSKNSSWTDFLKINNKYTERDKELARQLMSGDDSGIPASDVVYYHDKSIETPSSWTNKYWKPVLVKTTEHFKFYKIVPASSKPIS